MKIRIPDYTSFYLDGARLDFCGEACKAEDACVRFEIKDDALTVFATSYEKGARYVRLRWNNEMRKDVKVLGDAWERGYGDLNWGPIHNERCMPWYMAASNGTDSVLDYTGRYTECFGVGVQPNAMAFWQYDTKGVTLWLDIRNGGDGTLLFGRELLCALAGPSVTLLLAFGAARLGAVVFAAVALQQNAGREKPMAIVLEGSTYQKSPCLQTLLGQELETLRKTYGVGFAVIAAENTTLTGSAYAAVSNT